MPRSVTAKRASEPYVRTDLDGRVESFLSHSAPAMLAVIGPAGLGKSLTVRKVLERSSLPSVLLPAATGQSLDDMFGVWTLRNGETKFVEGALLRGLKTPDCVIVLDDAHVLAQGLQLLNGIGDQTRCVSFSAQGDALDVADGVRLVIIANPPPATLPPWEAHRWQIPEQTRSRCRLIRLDHGLSYEDELAVAAAHWPGDHPAELLEGLVEIARNLRDNGVTGGYTPSLRDLAMIGHLLSQGHSLGEAFAEGLAHKYLQLADREAAIESFRGKFGFDPLTGGSVLDRGGDADA